VPTRTAKIRCSGDTWNDTTRPAPNLAVARAARPSCARRERSDAPRSRPAKPDSRAVGVRGTARRAVLDAAQEAGEDRGLSRCGGCRGAAAVAVRSECGGCRGAVENVVGISAVCCRGNCVGGGYCRCRGNSGRRISSHHRGNSGRRISSHHRGNSGRRISSHHRGNSGRRISSHYNKNIANTDSKTATDTDTATENQYRTSEELQKSNAPSQRPDAF
jgi:hypothetical protein